MNKTIPPRRPGKKDKQEKRQKSSNKLISGENSRFHTALRNKRKTAMCHAHHRGAMCFSCRILFNHSHETNLSICTCALTDLPKKQ